jgi:hypothetical protein
MKKVAGLRSMALTRDGGGRLFKAPGIGFEWNAALLDAFTKLHAA